MATDAAVTTRQPHDRGRIRARAYLGTEVQYRLEGNTKRGERIDRVVAFQSDADYRLRITSRGRYSGSR